MDYLIILKWTINWGYYPSGAPSIITSMINLPLGMGQTVIDYIILARLLWSTTYVGNLWKHFSRQYSVNIFDNCTFMYSNDVTT
jgi:hypothetical protein